MKGLDDFIEGKYDPTAPFNQADFSVDLWNEDCMITMKRYEDKYFDLAIVDPPYGLEWSGTGFKKKNIQERNLATVKEWETKAPTQEFFDELKRVSKEQIIWGGNYFGDYLGKCKAPIIWDKQTGNNTFADGEMAWTSFKTGTLRIFRHQWCGAFKDSERGIQSIHPTQKPVALYKWCIEKFTEGEIVRILDTHAGSGSSAIAAQDMQVDYVGSEIDKEYYEAACVRLDNFKRQLKMF
jgi:site-specific DNA-methyltransferase (adenine-specific)